MCQCGGGYPQLRRRVERGVLALLPHRGIFLPPPPSLRHLPPDPVWFHKVCPTPPICGDHAHGVRLPHDGSEIGISQSIYPLSWSPPTIFQTVVQVDIFPVVYFWGFSFGVKNVVRMSHVMYSLWVFLFQTPVQKS